eukprot:6192871-Pleurochrysis_carterae.AAC.4
MRTISSFDFILACIFRVPPPPRLSSLFASSATADTESTGEVWTCSTRTLTALTSAATPFSSWRKSGAAERQAKTPPPMRFDVHDPD